MIEPAHDIEQRGLAAAGRTEQHHHFLLGDLQIDIVERMDLHLAGDVGFGQGRGCEDRFGHYVSLDYALPRNLTYISRFSE